MARREKEVMTTDEFDEILLRILEEEGSNIIDIAGVYEAVSEYFNDDVIEIWKSEHDED